MKFKCIIMILVALVAVSASLHADPYKIATMEFNLIDKDNVDNIKNDTAEIYATESKKGLQPFLKWSGDQATYLILITKEFKKALKKYESWREIALRDDVKVAKKIARYDTYMMVRAHKTGRCVDCTGEITCEFLSLKTLTMFLITVTLKHGNERLKLQYVLSFNDEKPMKLAKIIDDENMKKAIKKEKEIDRKFK